MAGSFLKQSTASQSRAIGPFIDSTDFVTAETALTINNTDILLITNGGASAAKNSGGGTHRANGIYGVTFDATDTATVGEIEVSVKVSGALQVFHKFWVLEEAIYDALFGASAAGFDANGRVDLGEILGTAVSTPATAGILDVNVKNIDNDAASASGTITFPNATLASTTNITAGTITTATNVTTVNGLAAGVVTAATIATDAIDADAISADAKAEIAFAVAEEPPSAHPTADSIGGMIDLIDDMSGNVGDIENRIGAFPATNNNTIYGWLRALMRKDITVPSDIGGTYAPSTDSLEAHVDTGVALTANSVSASALATDAVTEIVTAVWAKTLTELSAVPGITADTLSALNWLFTLHRNKRTETSATETLFKDDGSTALATSTKADDGTTFTAGEYA